MNYKIFYSSDKGSFIKAITYGYNNSENLVVFIDEHKTAKSSLKFIKDCWKMISKKRKELVEWRISIYCNGPINWTKKNWEEHFKNTFEEEFDIWFPKAGFEKGKINTIDIGWDIKWI